MSFVNRLLSPSKSFLLKIIGKNPIDDHGTSDTESSADEIHNSDQTEELSLIGDLRNSEQKYILDTLLGIFPYDLCEKVMDHDEYVDLDYLFTIGRKTNYAAYDVVLLYFSALKCILEDVDTDEFVIMARSHSYFESMSRIIHEYDSKFSAKRYEFSCKNQVITKNLAAIASILIEKANWSGGSWSKVFQLRVMQSTRAYLERVSIGAGFKNRYIPVPLEKLWIELALEVINAFNETVLEALGLSGVDPYNLQLHDMKTLLKIVYMTSNGCSDTEE
mgnify:CR=1 FL=1|jgi:hypothetical protein